LNKSRRNYSGEEEASILKRHLLVKESVSDICDDIGIAPAQFYHWQKEFLDNAAFSFQKKDRKSNGQVQVRKLEEKVRKLEARLKHKDIVIAEITEDYVKLKKNFGEI
jgi:transposase-like protein